MEALDKTLRISPGGSLEPLLVAALMRQVAESVGLSSGLV